MYRFPDPLDEDSLKALVADPRYGDTSHPEYPYYRQFVDKAFSLVYPDPPRNEAGDFVVDPRDPPQPQIITGAAAFRLGETAAASEHNVVSEPASSDEPMMRSRDPSLQAQSKDQILGLSMNPTALGREESKSGYEGLYGGDSSQIKIAGNVGVGGEDAKSGYADLHQPVQPMLSPVSNPRMRQPDSLGVGNFGPGLRDGGTRPHNGVDIVAHPGQQVRSPVDGIVVGTFDPYRNGPDPRKRGKVTGIQIMTPDGDMVTIIYVDVHKGITPGSRVITGMPLGSVQNITKVYDDLGKPGMTNHVHVGVRQRNGEYRDAWPAIQKGPNW